MLVPCSLSAHTGQLKLPGGIRIGPHTQLRDVPRLSATQQSEMREAGAGWHWQNLWYQWPGSWLSIHLGFQHQQLRTLLFTFPTFAGEMPRKDWAEWSESKEQAAALVYNQWLTNQLGAATRHFAWGEAWASYDPRSGGSAVGISYA